MAKEKSPAFLFYSKDWIQGTAKFLPSEKGVYIDLLCHQHQDGFLPERIDRLARITGLSIDEFIPIWDIIKIKFKIDDKGFFNEKLRGVIEKNELKSKKNKIIGNFSALLRERSPLPVLYKIIKDAFNYEDFMDIPEEDLKQELNEWYNERSNERSNER